MFYIGKKIRFNGSEAIILTISGDDVLIFIEKDYVKWVDKDLLELYESA